MSLYDPVPEPGDSVIRIEYVKSAVEEFEQAQRDAEDAEAEEVVLPFPIEQYVALRDFCREADWAEEAIEDDYFVEYITQLIDDCYGDIPGKRTGWPYRHITVDYVAAAEEAKQDYTPVEFGGVTYWCR